MTPTKTKIANYEEFLDSLEGKERAAIDCHLTDTGNGKRLAIHFGDKLRYLWDTGQWLYFDGHQWNPETGTEQAYKLAKETALGIYEEAGLRSTPNEREQTAKWAIRSEADSRINAMLSQARSESPISAYSKDFDVDPYQFNSKDWVIDLRTGSITPQHPNYNLTKMGGCKFIEDAKCPTWDKCVNDWMEGDGEKIKYLQMILGLCLTGDISARIFPIFHGQGFNGKSKCLDAVSDILGDYATLGTEDLLAERKTAQHPCDIAKLKGKRLVVVDESKKNMRLRTSLVKRMTGDTELTGRLMRQNFEDFNITHKIVLMTQNLPIITETADAIWDRVHLLKWNRQFGEDERDSKLAEKLKPEYPGILNWLIKGCLNWQAAGHKVKRPESVKMAGDEYRQESDPLGEFIEAKCVLDKQYATPVKAMKDAYKNWCDENDIKFAVGRQNFNAYLRERGCECKNIRVFGNTAKCWQGIGLQDEIG